MSDIYPMDFQYFLTGASDDGTTLTWRDTLHGSASGSHVADINEDGDMDIGQDAYVSGLVVFTGYTININGNDYAIFHNGTSSSYSLPYNSAIDDISGFLSGAGSTSTKMDNADVVNCFLRGTLIGTPDGEAAVETLQIGDFVRTADGRDCTVKWVGRQTITANLVNIACEDNRAPVRIAAGALGNHSDLYVSADHGMIMDGLVINASALVNGDTIRFVPMSEMPSEFTYYHIETEAHDVILANGAASETFIDAAGRAAFDNCQEYLDLYGAERIIPEMDRPRISSRRLVPHAIKDRLAGCANVVCNVA